MGTVSATGARKRHYARIDEVGQSHHAVQITGQRGTAVLLTEEDWRAIQATLHRVSIPGMRESILEGMATDVSDTRLVTWTVLFTRQAQKDARKLASASPALKHKAQELLDLLAKVPTASLRPRKPWSEISMGAARGGSTSCTGLWFMCSLKSRSSRSSGFGAIHYP